MGTSLHSVAPVSSGSNTEQSVSSWAIFWLAVPVVFMVSLDATVVVAAFPALRRHFSGASPADLSWALNGYTIVFASLLVPCGRLADRLGSKRCFMHGLLLFTVASGACAIAGSAFWLAVARVLQAIGAALLSPSSMAIILAEFPGSKRQKAVSWVSAVGALAAALGPGFGSAIIQWISWPFIFLVNVPIGAVVWWRARSGLPNRPPEETAGGWDPIGTGMLILGVSCLAFGIVEAGEDGFRPAHTWGSLLAGVVVLGFFPLHARRQLVPALELDLFTDHQYRWASLATFLFGTALGMMFLCFYLFMIGVWHYAQSLAGFIATLGPLMVVAVAVGGAGWSSRWGHRSLLIAGGVLYACSNLWYGLRLSGDPHYLSIWLPGQLVGSFAVGLLIPMLTGAAVAGLPQRRLAVGNAVNAALRQLGGSLGVAITIALVGDPEASLTRFRMVYGCLALLGLLVALSALPLRTSIASRRPMAPAGFEP